MFLHDLVISAEKVVSEANNRELRHSYLSFQRHTFCVTDLYLQVLGNRLETNDAAKLIITVASNATNDPLLIPLLPKVWEMEWSFALSRYLDFNIHEKKKAILDHLHAALMYAVQHKEWNKDVLYRTYENLVCRNIENAGFMKSGRMWLSPNGAQKQESITLLTSKR